jgi:hypothetical protein
LNPNEKNKAKSTPDRKRTSSASPSSDNDSDKAVDEGTPSCNKRNKKSPSTTEIDGDDKNQEDSVSLDSVSRRRRWKSLLTDRPSQLEEIHPWLGRVLSISNSKNASASASKLDSPDSTSESHNDAIQESRWIDLLEQRPSPEKGDAAATKWLVQVLEASCTQQDESSSLTVSEDAATGDAVKPKEENAFSL